MSPLQPDGLPTEELKDHFNGWPQYRARPEPSIEELLSPEILKVFTAVQAWGGLFDPEFLIWPEQLDANGQLELRIRPINVKSFSRGRVWFKPRFFWIDDQGRLGVPADELRELEKGLRLLAADAVGAPPPDPPTGP